jgi:hypothetical protein
VQCHDHKTDNTIDSMLYHMCLVSRVPLQLPFTTWRVHNVCCCIMMRNTAQGALARCELSAAAQTMSVCNVIFN